MTPQPPERISFALLKIFAKGGLLFIPWESYVRFHEDILWCLCCCNRLRLWRGAGQLVYIPVFSLVQVHHEHIAHMWHFSLLDAAKTIHELPDWGMDNVKFSFQASMGCFGVVVCSVNAAYCALVHAPNLWRKESGAVSTVVTSRSADTIVFQPVQDGRRVRSPVRWIKHQKRRPNC